MSDDSKLGPIDASLRRSFAPPPLEALEAKIEEAAARAERTDAASVVPMRRGLWVGLVVATAAAVILLIVRPWGETLQNSPTTLAASPQTVARQELGLRLVGFHRSGTPRAAPDGTSCVGPAPPPANCEAGDVAPWLPPNDELEILGECGAPGQEPCAQGGLPPARLVRLRTRTGGAELLVCVEPKSADPRPMLPDDAGLQLFRRELGEFVLYEVTPLDKPTCLDLFSL